MRRESAGFTLLEVMVAFAILSLTLVVLIGIVTNNVRATNHAKMTTAATFLARGKMVDLEDDILYNGFSTANETAKGSFKADGFPQFSWESSIERVELPTDLAQRTKDEAQDKAKDSKDPMSLMTGFLGGMMGSFIEPIRIGLQESVRRVTVRVLWDEVARPEQMVEVIQYLTDPSKLGLALNPGAALGGATSGTTGTAGTSGSTAPNPGGFGLGSFPNMQQKLPGQR